MKKIFSLILIITLNLTVTGQKKNQGIIFPTYAEKNLACKRCKKAFSQKIKETRFSIVRDKNKLYFMTNDKNFFNALFQEKKDGIAIDIVSRDIYECAQKNNNDQIIGELLKPVYTKELKKNLKPYGEGSFRVFLGDVPKKLIGKELEYNMLFLNDNKLCRYQVLYKIKGRPWDILDMGMYLDTVNISSKSLPKENETIIDTRYKNLKFTVPFEKNKMVYSKEDIKPIYDSLNLTDFNIKSINIKAYASVEGSLKRNIELQNGRANTIAQALQTYQKPNIERKITASENWVEFFNDIENTKYEYLKSLSKNAIKGKLVGALNRQMEPILKNHRKAVINLEMEKKELYTKMSGNQLVGAFNDAIKNNQLDKASKIQNSLFKKMRAKEVSPKLLNKLEVPRQAKYIDFLNNKSSAKYLLNKRKIITVRDELLALQKLQPNNPKIKYNLVVLKFRIWRYRFENVNPQQLVKEIKELKKYNISDQLIERMMINYHIIQSMNYNRQKKYDKKDQSLAYIKNTYLKLPLTDYDYYSLAQFLSFYANLDSASELLSPIARKVDVDEDLLFYYIKLTILDDDITGTDEYRAILLNAASQNKERYCDLFNSSEKGGITFQLLQNKSLKDSYCENCND